MLRNRGKTLWVLVAIVNLVLWSWVWSYTHNPEPKYSQHPEQPIREITNCPYGDTLDKATCEKFAPTEQEKIPQYDWVKK